MRVLAPAKINLHLRVGRRRGDGFHPLLSWMTTVGLFDILEFNRVQSPGFALACDRADLPCDDENLIVKAASALEAAAAAGGSGSPCGVAAFLSKRIPVGAGLGGGSSDGAHALLALNQMWNLKLSVGELSELSARLGSDLPFFFHAPSAIVSGRGEHVRPTPAPGQTVSQNAERMAAMWALLILPAIHLSTAEAYRRFDDLKLGSDELVENEPNWQEWSQLSAGHLLPLLSNDLEAAAFSLRQDLAQLRMDCERELGWIVRMSGSGSSLFSLYDDEASAGRAAEIIRDRHDVDALAVPVAPEIRDDCSDGLVER
ncbi:MAG TPA: 4-(cytidine 5'-diphospho)-2-C-methyl-D-erythritol kinase [Tepidisphaeraceae bacterium]